MFFRYIIFNCDIFCSREGFGSHSMFLKWSNKYKGYIGLDITWRNQNGFCPGGIIRIALISYLLSLCLLCPRHLHSLIFYMVYYLILVLCAKLLLSCPTLCHPMDCSPAGSSVHAFSRQEYRGGLCFLLQGMVPTQGSMEPTSRMSPALAGMFFTTRATWEFTSSILWDEYIIVPIFQMRK